MKKPEYVRPPEITRRQRRNARKANARARAAQVREHAGAPSDFSMGVDYAAGDVRATAQLWLGEVSAARALAAVFRRWGAPVRVGKGERRWVAPGALRCHHGR